MLYGISCLCCPWYTVQKSKEACIVEAMAHMAHSHQGTSPADIHHVFDTMSGAEITAMQIAREVPQGTGVSHQVDRVRRRIAAQQMEWPPPSKFWTQTRRKALLALENEAR